MNEVILPPSEASEQISLQTQPWPLPASALQSASWPAPYWQSPSGLPSPQTPPETSDCWPPPWILTTMMVVNTWCWYMVIVMPMVMMMVGHHLQLLLKLHDLGLAHLASLLSPFKVGLDCLQLLWHLVVLLVCVVSFGSCLLQLVLNSFDSVIVLIKAKYLEREKNISPKLITQN